MAIFELRFMISILVTISIIILGLVLWWWNEIWYVRSVKARCSIFNIKLPPGHLGLPLLGETLSFLWFFNWCRRPDDFINYKKSKHGDNVGAYKTHLYGSPSIIACSPTLCKLVLHSSDKFKQEWPTTEVLGTNSVITLQGPRHGLIKSYIENSINRPDSLTRFLRQVQPTIIEALQLWSQKPKITAIHQVTKLTLGYTMKYFAGLEDAKQVDTFEKLLEGITHGMRAQPWNFPGTTYHHALMCRKEITKRLKEHLEKRKQSTKVNNNTSPSESASDLMEGLMQMKDADGKKLSVEEILDNVVSTIHIGHVSIAFVITWSLYFLAKSPHVFQNLQEENKHMSREKKGEYITYEDIMKLKYTKKVIEETIRTATHQALFFEKLLKILNLKFRPKHGTYLPFGGGPRSCPGYSLARLSLALFLHHLSIGYTWKLLNPNSKVNYSPHPIPADGVKICLRRN